MPSMNDWMTVLNGSTSANPATVIMRLIVAWVAGWLVSQCARAGRSTYQDRTLPATLILLSVLIAMATQIIGDNVARAFSLVGAQSIVRFRTAVPTTGDIAHVLAAVVIGMSVGAGQYAVSFLGLLILGAVSILHTPTIASQSLDGIATGALTVQVTLGSEDRATEALVRACRDFQLVDVSTARKGASLSYTYQVRLRPEISPRDIIFELNRQEGLESVAWESTR